MSINNNLKKSNTMPAFSFNKLKGIKDLINKQQWKFFQRLTLGYTTVLSVPEGSILALLLGCLYHITLLQCSHSTYHYMELSFYFATYSLLLLYFYFDAPSAKDKSFQMELFMLKPMLPSQDSITVSAVPEVESYQSIRNLVISHG